MSQSSVNSFIGTIPAGGSFTGKPEVINGSISIVCFLNNLVDLTIKVFQSVDGITYFQTDTYVAIVADHGPQSRVQFYIKGQKGYIQVQNLGSTDAVDTVLRTLYTPNNHDGTILQPSYVIVEGMPTPGPITGIVEVSKIDQALPAGTNALGSVSVSNLPATQPISGTVAVSSISSALPAGTNALGSVSVSNLPATQPISGTVAVSSIASALPAGTNALGSVSVSNLPAQPLVYGENSNFVFYPTPANNTITVYADGTQGVNVNGGWSYANIANSGKINWYCYASATPATDYKVSQLTSMYTVINQQSTLGLSGAQNPFIIFYTRPTSTATTFYQNKFFFGSNAGTDTTGIKFLYTGSDPVDIHPEIVAPNRIQLLFNSTLSTSTLALAQNESIFLGSLQTTNATPTANSFFFTMQEFGVDWVKTPALLPIEFNKLQISGSVSTLNTSLSSTVKYTSVAGGFATPAFDISKFGVTDVIVSITSISGGDLIFTGQASIDGINWFDATTITVSSLSLTGGVSGFVSASSFYRVVVKIDQLLTATGVTISIAGKSL